MDQINGNISRRASQSDLNSETNHPSTSMSLPKIGQNIENQEENNALIKEIAKNQQKIFDRIELLEKQLDEQKKNDKIDKEEPLKKKTKLDNRQEKSASFPSSAKQFKVTNIFKDVSKFKEDGPIGDAQLSYHEDYFGFSWIFTMRRENEKFVIYLFCDVEDSFPEATNWTLQTGFDLKLINSDGEVIYDDLIQYYVVGGKPYTCVLFDWEEMKNKLSADDQLKAEIRVVMGRMTGLYAQNLRRFDESVKEKSDVVLVVDDEKFYVAKKRLASHSSYFKSLFLKYFGEAGKPEILLKYIDQDDFQKYLEVVHGEDAIDDYNVEGVLLIADMYDTPLVIRKCEEFLLARSEKKTCKILEIAFKYSLEKLKKEFLSRINTMEGIREAIPDNTESMDPSLMAILLKKTLSAN